ncbi:MAG: pilus (MSHA type) biogenesis protein MshL [Desulfuromonadaceae bacterium]|nr:pilus (MSHA type) biogenesis protein MshL [Desulfuromonadaceae bacterium]
MALHRMTPFLRKFTRLLCLASLLAAFGCSSQQNALNSRESLIKEKIPRNNDPPSLPLEYKAPEFFPVTEEIVPLKTKIVNIVVRNSSLGDVLHVLAESSGLNLLIDRDVALDQSVTLTLRNVSAQEALKDIFSSVDCFYTIQGNTLKVASVTTKIFELGHPALINSYSMDVGGDILGGAMVTAGGGSGSSNLKGAITTGSKADATAHDFWGSLEKSLSNVLGKNETAAERPAENRTQPLIQTSPGQGRNQQSTQNITNISNRSSGGQSTSGRAQQNITINRLTGTIMVTATRMGMDRVERYLDNVRKVLSRQVMIEARIIEVQLNEGLNFGIDWSFLENVKALGGTVNAGFGALNMATRSFAPATDTAANASKFQVGVSRANFQTLLTALKTQGDVKTLSNPKINVMNGHASILTVGRNTSYISKVTSTTTAATGSTPLTTFNVETGSILSGMIIGIVPYISESGEISLNVTPITSDLVKLDEKSVGAAGNQTTISIPTVDLREMTTTVKMHDGQLVIIGGLISRKSSTQDEKVPFIGDIPFLGKLFTREKISEERSELVLLLRPQIVSGE